MWKVCVWCQSLPIWISRIDKFCEVTDRNSFKLQNCRSLGFWQTISFWYLAAIAKIPKEMHTSREQSLTATTLSADEKVSTKVWDVEKSFK